MTYPENTNGVIRAIWRSIRFDHTKHSVQLPADKEDDEKMMRIPKAFEVDLSLFLSREEGDDS